MNEKPKDRNKFLMEMLKDTSVPASDRGDLLIYNVTEHGIDLRVGQYRRPWPRVQEEERVRRQ